MAEDLNDLETDSDADPDEARTVHLGMDRAPGPAERSARFCADHPDAALVINYLESSGRAQVRTAVGTPEGREAFAADVRAQIPTPADLDAARQSYRARFAGQAPVDDGPRAVPASDSEADEVASVGSGDDDDPDHLEHLPPRQQEWPAPENVPMKRICAVCGCMANTCFIWCLPWMDPFKMNGFRLDIELDIELDTGLDMLSQPSPPLLSLLHFLPCLGA